MQSSPSLPPPIPALRSSDWSPVSSDERIGTMDILRGFALFGILTVNMIAFSWPAEQLLFGQHAWKSGIDAIVDWIVRFLAEGKFYPLFAFLFGLGAAIQMQRAEARGANFNGRFCRRLAVLFVFGLAHAILLWEGDILVWYAICGFLLLAFRKRQPKTLLLWAAPCLLIPSMLLLLCWALVAGLSLVPQFAGTVQKELAQLSTDSGVEFEDTIRIFAHESYFHILVHRLGNLLWTWLGSLFYVPTFFSMFLVGLYVGKRGIVQNVEAHTHMLRRVLIWGLVIGVPCNLFFSFSMATSDISDVRFLWILGYAFVTVGGPAQSLAYMAGITLLLRRESWKRWLGVTGPAGRMPLTNYLLQSLICTTIFYGYGFGLFGSMGRATSFGLTVAIYVMQIILSLWWMKRFQFGPVEWLWRTLSYGKRQPMVNVSPSLQAER